jgi:hypothetical protein
MSTDDIDRLFEVPPEAFVKERDQLARSLKEEGQEDVAAEVKSLRKPTLPAWALNQLVRRHREKVQRLMEAGQEVRALQREADPQELRRVAQRRRDLISDLVGAAGPIVEEQGSLTEATIRAIEATLEAASADPDVGQDVLRGRLNRPLERATGFDAMGGLAAVPGAGREKPDPAEEARAEEGRLRKAVQDAQRQLEEAERDLRRAEMRAETLAAEAKKIAARIDQAKEDVAEKKAARADVRRKVQRATRALARAEAK